MINPRTHPEVFHGNSQGVKNLHINGIVLQINKLHLLSDLLESCFRGQGSQISSHVTVSVLGYYLQIYVIV